jgi:6-phospho-3-hexuloisomerase
MLSLQAMAKRFNHIGIRAYCVGDINEPAITENDLLIVGSSSGESLIPVAIAKKAKQLNAKIAHIGSNPNSTISPITDFFVRIPVNSKLKLSDETISKQIMTSLFEQCLYIFGDSIAWIIAEKRCFDKDKLWKHHANLE